MRIGRTFWIFVAGLAIGFVLAAFLAAFAELFLLASREPVPPKVAGQQVPPQKYQIDFSKRYNLKLASHYGSATYDNCLVKGFTLAKEDSSRGIGYFAKWVVVELPDERLVYLPPGSIEVIEEAQQ